MNGSSILVVDDDRSIRETLHRQLTEDGYYVSIAESAEAAISQLGRGDD